MGEDWGEQGAGASGAQAGGNVEPLAGGATSVKLGLVEPGNVELDPLVETALLGCPGTPCWEVGKKEY